MKRISGLFLLAALGVAGSGCTDTPSSGPVGPGGNGAVTSGYDMFILNGPGDPRLEESGLAGHDGTIAPAEEPGDGISGGAADAAGPSGESSSSREAPSVFWNRLTTELCAGMPPPKYARSYALVHAAIYDALAASRHGRRRGRLIENVVAAGAASTVLEYLFPAAADRIRDTLELRLRSGHGKEKKRIRRSLEFGRKVGELAVEHGMNDGSDAVFTGTTPAGPGVWTGTNPVLPMCGQWTTWICENGAEFQPEPPYVYGSEQDSIEVEQVYEASLNRTAEQVAIVHKWADLPPPTIWNNILNERIAGRRLGALAAARAHAYLNCAMYDAFVSCWYTKYAHWTARPFMRLDGRSPAFTTVVPTPNFPTYTSGHSTISGAAAVVMGKLFPDQAAWFNAEADEAALSRFYGGIHFHHDDNQGLVVGRLIGERVVARMRSGPIALGGAP